MAYLNRTSDNSLLIASMAALALLSGCTAKKVALPPPVAPEPPKIVAPAYEAPRDLGAKERILRIIKLLEDGNEAHARVDLRAYLAQFSASKLGQSLQSQIEQDPVVLLGAENYLYEVKASESLSQLAERFLGDRYKFWALARYNGISNPLKIIPGQKIKIPGVPKPAENVAKSVPDDEEIARRLAEELEDKKPVVKVEPPKPVPVGDSIKAMALRKLGLENLQRGKIDAAISLLRQAVDTAFGTQSLALIQKDLARALRLKERLR